MEKCYERNGIKRNFSKIRHNHRKDDFNSCCVDVCFVLAMAALIFVKAFAGTDTTAVDDLWTTFSGYAAGAPGKIIALLSFMSAVWYGIARPNYTLAIGSLMFCLMMANAKDIIEGFLTMTI